MPWIKQTSFFSQKVGFCVYILRIKSHKERTQLTPFINIPGKLVKYYKQTNIWAEEDAGKMSNIDFSLKQHIKTIFEK